MAKKIDRETFKRTERALFNYFEQETLVKSLKYKICRLENQIKQIDDDIKNTNISIPLESKSQTYEERVQTSSDGCSYAEREVIKAIDRLEKEKESKNTTIAVLKTEIRNIEENSTNIEFNIKMLSDEDYKFIELKYKNKLSVEEVSDKLNLARSTGYNKRERLVNDIASWCDIIK